ncbi:MAG: hypothetical protein FWH34_04485 [Desulfovibrionaceae bacterium]|nr:hypothetical protein [Desulfovibrionaceae bacterium]
MYKYCTAILLCALCASCSPRPGSSFGFTDGKPIHLIREDTKEECLRAAERRCQGGFTVLEEGPFARYQGGWVDPGRHKLDHAYSVRVKCDSH